MKYIKNNTDNTYVITDIIEGKQKELVFLKNTVTTISDEVDEAFSTFSNYEYIFDNNFVSYVPRPTEINNDFVNYLKSYSFETINDVKTLKVGLDTSLAGEAVEIEYFTNQSAQMASGYIESLPDDGIIEVAPVDAEEWIEFQVIQYSGSDFTRTFTNRVKFYI